MKNTATFIFFALFTLLFSCEKEDIIPGPPEGNYIKPKSIDWKFTSVSTVSDSGYYSIQPYQGPGIWQYTRTTQMNITGLVQIDAEPVKFTGNFYTRQAAGNKPYTEGYMQLCEARDDNTNHCLEFVIINKVPVTDIKSLSDLKLPQAFLFSLRVDSHSGRYDRAENNSREVELKIVTNPQTLSYTLNLTGGLVY